MDNDKVKDTNMKIPIEKHETAASRIVAMSFCEPRS